MAATKVLARADAVSNRMSARKRLFRRRRLLLTRLRRISGTASETVVQFLLGDGPYAVVPSFGTRLVARPRPGSRRRANSAAIAVSRSSCPSAQWLSMVTSDHQCSRHALFTSENKPYRKLPPKGRRSNAVLQLHRLDHQIVGDAGAESIRGSQLAARGACNRNRPCPTGRSRSGINTDELRDVSRIIS
jgi:hypothetical protein